MKNCCHGDSYKSYMPAKAGIFYIFRVGIHALEILDTQLLLNYTMISHGV